MIVFNLSGLALIRMLMMRSNQPHRLMNYGVKVKLRTVKMIVLNLSGQAHAT
jgi:hypothetical protein